MEGEATPTRSVPLPKEEEELREEEWGGGKVAVANWAVDDAHHFTLHFYYKY